MWFIIDVICCYFVIINFCWYSVEWVWYIFGIFDFGVFFLCLLFLVVLLLFLVFFELDILLFVCLDFLFLLVFFFNDWYFFFFLLFGVVGKFFFVLLVFFWFLINWFFRERVFNFWYSRLFFCFVENECFL